MRRMLLLCFVISAFATANWPTLVYAELSGEATPESTGAQQTGAEGEIKKAQKQLEGLQTKSTAQQIKQAGDSCISALKAGKSACNESTSPFIQQMMQALPGLAAAILSASGKDKCNAMAKGLEALKGLQGNYSSDCGAKKTACTKACSDANTKISQAMTTGCQMEAKSLATPPADQPLAEACQQAAQANQQAVSQGVDACNALQANENAGKANEKELGQGQGNSEQCSADEAVDCSKTPDDPSCPKALDCNTMSPAEAAKTPQCACVLSPNGCNGQSTLVTNPNTGGDTKAGEIPEGATVGGTDSAADGVDGGGHGGSAGSGLPGAPGGADGGAKGGAGADKDKNGKEKEKKNDVLGGEAPGGGMKYGGGGYADDGGKAALADKVNKQMAADKLAKQVSGSHGLTNWEKVNSIAKENGPKLIPDRK